MVPPFLRWPQGNDWQNGLGLSSIYVPLGRKSTDRTDSSQTGGWAGYGFRPWDDRNLGNGFPPRPETTGEADSRITIQSYAHVTLV